MRIGWNRAAAGGVEPGVRAEELAGWLTVMGVDDVTSAAVRVGEEAERCWCVRAVPEEPGGEDGRDGEERDGEGGDEGWEVFWVEQGGRYEWMRFADEATACFALFGRLVWAHAVRLDAAREQRARSGVRERRGR